MFLSKQKKKIVLLGYPQTAVNFSGLLAFGYVSYMITIMKLCIHLLCQLKYVVHMPDP